jgi:hypothetical protein
MQRAEPVSGQTMEREQRARSETCKSAHTELYFTWVFSSLYCIFLAGIDRYHASSLGRRPRKPPLRERRGPPKNILCEVSLGVGADGPTGSGYTHVCLGVFQELSQQTSHLGSLQELFLSQVPRLPSFSLAFNPLFYFLIPNKWVNFVA